MWVPPPHLLIALPFFSRLKTTRNSVQKVAIITLLNYTKIIMEDVTTATIRYRNNDLLPSKVFNVLNQILQKKKIKLSLYYYHINSSTIP